MASLAKTLAEVRRAVEKTLPKITLEVESASHFRRYSPRDQAKQNIRETPGNPRLFAIEEFPSPETITAGHTTDKAAIRAGITVGYPIGGKWIDVVGSDYEKIRRALLAATQAAAFGSAVDYCILDAMTPPAREVVEGDPPWQWVVYPMLIVVDATDG